MSEPTAEQFVQEERFVPVAESGVRWAGRSREAAEEAMRQYPAGGEFASGDPWDGITHIEREVRFVTDWTAPLAYGGRPMTADLQAQLAEFESAMRAELDDLCSHAPDEHAEGCCETCDYAFAVDVVVQERFEALAALVSAHVAQVREGLADEIEARRDGALINSLEHLAYSDAARIVRPSVGPREQRSDFAGDGKSEGHTDSQSRIGAGGGS